MNIGFKKISQEELNMALDKCVQFMADENFDQKMRLEEMFDGHISFVVGEDDCRNICFKNLDLSGLDLSHEEQLIWIKFENVNLTGAKLIDCELEWVVFEQCNMRGMDLSGTRISEGGGFFNSDLEDAILRNFEKTNAYFVDCNMQGVDFTRAELLGFGGIENCNLTNANMNEVLFDGDGYNIKDSILKGTTFKNASIEGNVSFVNSPLAEAVFENTTLENRISMNGMTVEPIAFYQLITNFRDEWIEKERVYMLEYGISRWFKEGLTDVQVAKELLQSKGMDKVEVALLIGELSPNLPGRSDDKREFVKAAIKQAEKEIGKEKGNSQGNER